MNPPKYPATENVSGEIRALMGRHRTSQKELAQVLDLSQPSISARLNGEREWSIDELDTVAGHYDVSIVDLFPDQGERSTGWLSDTVEDAAESVAA